MTVSEAIKLIPLGLPVDPNWSKELESGHVLFDSQSSFRLESAEQGLLDPRWVQLKRKHIAFDPTTKQLDGVNAPEDIANGIDQLMRRFADFSWQTIKNVLPRYPQHLQWGKTSLRLHPVGNRSGRSWRQNDQLLHVDAFPSRPMGKRRILRVFQNIHASEPRVWRLGATFSSVFQQFSGRLPKPNPLLANLYHRLGVTKNKRTSYDHYMLALHDAMKSDSSYQFYGQQQTVAFPASSLWICFSDQVPHAAMAGQLMLEQTFYLPADYIQYHHECPWHVIHAWMASLKSSKHGV